MLGIALGIGLLVASIVLEALFPGGERDIGPRLAKTDIDHFLLLLGYVIASIGEEIQFRGYFLQQLAVYTRSTGAAVALQAVFFVFAHGSGQGLSGYLTRFAIGIAFGLAAVHRKSLWPSMTAHLLINITVFIVGLTWAP
ncbi:MAG TPA: CPBP family intramembrane glutamic endopeptidase [Terracidiphilus sp.]|nr:CPBP family intramembrane glutamic endopeptidase [Terracidiphilus sp.]